ncbi:MAG: DNA primase [Gemmatimonadales bacterium]
MTMIPDELIEQIRDSADLVAIIGEAVPLKRTGSDWRGPCPFHGGTHRNFAVIPKKGMYYCYVCHAAGDVFTYVMKRQGLNYPEAVREVGRRLGITVPERDAGREGALGPDPREPLFTAVAAAQEWYAQCLREHSEAELCRRYLEGRDIPMEAAGEQGLGYAPRGDGREFRDAMVRLGITEATLEEAGLLFRREDGSRVPRFRQRLLFPIRDLRGRVVGFGGRLLVEGEPKYLNSPESPIFHKGAMLYNLFAAKQAIRREHEVLLVEGYFDVLRLVFAGIEQVVAPLGTGLTAEQAALLRRFAPGVVLLYDSDGPGLRATFRAGDECLRHKLRVRVATLPEGEDPDTLVRSGGTAVLAPVLHDAVDVLDRKIQLLERRGWFEGLEHRRDALDRLIPTIQAAADPVARDLYLTRVAERIGISRAVLEQEVAARPEYRPPAAPAAPAGSPAEAGRAGRVPPGASHEAQVLAILLSGPEWLERGRRELVADQFDLAGHRELFEALERLPAGVAVSAVAGELSPRGREVFERLAERALRERAAGLDPDELYVAAVDALRARELARRLPPVTAIEERQQLLRQLSPQERQRLLIRKATGRRAAPNAPPGPNSPPHS